MVPTIFEFLGVMLLYTLFASIQIVMLRMSEQVGLVIEGSIARYSSVLGLPVKAVVDKHISRAA